MSDRNHFAVSDGYPLVGCRCGLYTPQRRTCYNGIPIFSIFSILQTRLMNQSKREYFDKQVEWVLARLPQNMLHLLKEAPLHVEDQPSKRLMRELEIDDAEELCGYFRGVPTNTNLFRDYMPTPSSVTIFRRGIVTAARDEEGIIRRNELREQIRITILHELAHMLGMDEQEVEEIGYG